MVVAEVVLPKIPVPLLVQVTLVALPPSVPDKVATLFEQIVNFMDSFELDV